MSRRRVASLDMTKLLLLFFLIHFAKAGWMPYLSPASTRTTHRLLTRLAARDGLRGRDGGPSPADFRARLSIAGVSVSAQGFWAVLGIPQTGYLPIQVTSDPQDSQAATSAESLTIIQLLSGVDMAGPILPPDVLAQMLVVYCESENEDTYGSYFFADSEGECEDPKSVLMKTIANRIRSSLPENTTYSDAHPWFRSRIRLPKVTLDALALEVKDGATSWKLSCSLPDYYTTMSFHPNDQCLEHVSYAYRPGTSAAFTCLALALRYKAPMELLLSSESMNNDNILASPKEVNERFPMFTTVDNLRQSSNRVKQNIERGFKVNALTGALRIAMEKGDQQAVEQIRAKLDEYDSMEELPTLPLFEGDSLLPDSDRLQ